MGLAPVEAETQIHLQIPNRMLTFSKVGHNELVLWKAMWAERMHVLIYLEGSLRNKHMWKLR